MKNKLNQTVKNILLFVLLFALFLIGFIIYMIVTDYKPGSVKQIEIKGECKSNAPDNNKFSIITWNIGYASLGKEMDFFYEGGDMTRPTEKLFNKYWKNIKKFISDQDIVDFILIQEVDVHSKRSFYTNEKEAVENILPDHCIVFAVNYDVKYVPLPLLEPMGKVKSGMITASMYFPVDVIRNAYPNIASWPNRLFLLDRCFIETRYKLDNNKELVIFNTHNSVYVYDDSLRNIELRIIKEKMINEYVNGNYVVAGGDWNLNPAFGANMSIRFENNDIFKPTTLSMKENFLPAKWKYAYDKTYPTNRDLDSPYNKGRSGTTIIDYFIVSPNIEIDTVKTINMGFENTDHHPVFMNFKLSEK